MPTGNRKNTTSPLVGVRLVMSYAVNGIRWTSGFLLVQPAIQLRTRNGFRGRNGALGHAMEIEQQVS